MRRFGPRTLFVLITVCACVLGLGVYVVRSIDSSVRNMYAVWWVGSMMVEHLEHNEDQWPTCWGRRGSGGGQLLTLDGLVRVKS